MSAYTAWAPQEFDEAALDAAGTTATASAVDAPAQPGNGESTMPESEFTYDRTSGLSCQYRHRPPVKTRHLEIRMLPLWNLEEAFFTSALL